MNHRGGGGTLRALVFLALVGLLVPTLRAATNISRSSNTDSWGPRLTTDSAGNVYAVWLEKYSDTSGDIYFSKLVSSTGAWTTPQNISQSEKCCTNIKSSYHEADIDRDAHDNIYVVWAERTEVKLRILNSGGNWGSIFTVYSGGGLDGPILSVDGSGDIFVVWYTGYRIWGRARINGNWEANRQVSTGSSACKYPHVAAGTNEVYACWMQKTSNDYRIFWAKRNKTFNASWSSSAVVYNGPVPQTYPALKVDPSDVAHVIYLDEHAEGVRTAVYCRKSGSGFTSPVNLSNTSGLHYTSMSIQSTNVYGQWQCGPWGHGAAIRYNMKLSGSWVGEQSVPGSSGCTYGDIEADSEGKVHFVWDSGGEIYYYLRGDTPTPPNPPNPPPPPPPPVNKPPVADFNFSPKTGWAPQEIGFDGTASRDSDGRVVAWDWQFGDGGMASGGHAFHTFQHRGTYAVKLTVRDDSGDHDSVTKTIKIEGLFKPKNVDVAYHLDQSLFQSRWVATVTWEANSENEKNGYSIVKYQVFRRENDSEDDSYKYVSEIASNSPLEYLDTSLDREYQYSYAVRAGTSDEHWSDLAYENESPSPEPDQGQITDRKIIRKDMAKPPVKY
jgi:hypothetical protein